MDTLQNLPWGYILSAVAAAILVFWLRAKVRARRARLSKKPHVQVERAHGRPTSATSAATPPPPPPAPSKSKPIPQWMLWLFLLGGSGVLMISGSWLATATITYGVWVFPLVVAFLTWRYVKPDMTVAGFVGLFVAAVELAMWGFGVLDLLYMKAETYGWRLQVISAFIFFGAIAFLFLRKQGLIGPIRAKATRLAQDYLEPDKPKG